MRNSFALRCAGFALVAAVASPAVVHAHPGHDGHELTWDFGHLAAHPLATLGCFLAIAGLAWIGGRIVRALSAEPKKIRAEKDPAGPLT